MTLHAIEPELTGNFSDSKDGNVYPLSYAENCPLHHQ